MKYPLKELLAHCQDKPELWHQISQTLTLSPDGQQAEVSESIPALSCVEPEIKTSPWPFWARIISKLRKPSEIGLGDTIERLIGYRLSGWFKRRFKEKFGQSCGCSADQGRLNQRYPYNRGV